MKGKGKRNLTKAGWLVFWLYMVLLSYFLFFSERYGRENCFQHYRYNLVFFKEIRRFILYRKQVGFEAFIVNILGNILAFAPFGFILPLLDRKYRHILATAFLCLLFSVCVETVQLLLKVGIFDVDDIMMNTFGGVLGYLCFSFFYVIYRMLHPKKRK